MLIVFLLTASSARAQGCGPLDFTSPKIADDARVFTLEGRLEGYDRALPTLTVDGVEFHVPLHLPIDVDGDEVGDLDWAGLFESPWERSHTLVGGNVVAVGHVVQDSDWCYSLVADAVHVEFGEHVLVAPLTFVNGPQGQIEMAGARVALNADPRFPARLTGLGGKPLTIPDLSGFEGTLAAVEGYHEAGVFRALSIQTDAWVPNATTDTVILERATWDPSKESIEVRGYVSQSPNGTGPVANVALYVGAYDGVNCSGLFEASLPVLLAPPALLARFRYRSPDHAFPVQPASVCVRSAAGGGDGRPVVSE